MSAKASSSKGRRTSAATDHGLNPSQIEAVNVLSGPLLVLAGAGTGKTRVITYRIANLIGHEVPPGEILGLTFTNKAAREMRERLSGLMPTDQSREVFLGTFHSFCARLLRREIHHLGFSRDFAIGDDGDQRSIVKQAILEAGIQADLVDPETCLALISRAKGRLRTAAEVLRAAENGVEEAVARVYERYQQILVNQNMLDFDDLLVYVVRLWQDCPDVLTRARKQYRHILVDEYQDTNWLQFRLLELLAEEHRNLCVVGDDDQSIYGWRGAVVDNILRFDDHFPGARIVKLEQNYRSTNTILLASNRVIGRNRARHEKQLWSERGQGEKLTVVALPSAEAEAHFVCDRIDELMSRRDIELRYSDIAILYRSNHQSRQFEQACRDARLPYRIVGAKSFYERREIRDAVAYLKLLVNPRDDLSLLRILGAPPRGLGDKAVADLKDLRQASGVPMTELLGDDAYAERIGPRASSGAATLARAIVVGRDALRGAPGDLAAKVREYLRQTGFLDGLARMFKDRREAEERRDNVFELIHTMAEYEKRAAAAAPPTLAGFLENYALADDSDRVEEKDEGDGDQITLMTIHAAKGLEFASVFVVGMEDGLFPHSRALAEGGIEEERRLFYVALTRAKDRLCLSRAGERMRYGEMIRAKASPFLAELPKELVDKGETPVAGPAAAEAMRRALDNFAKLYQ
jgi:superfamily I DNA/RNA helicase